MREVVGLRIGIITTLGSGLTMLTGWRYYETPVLLPSWTPKGLSQTTTLGWPNRTWPSTR